MKPTVPLGYAVREVPGGVAEQPTALPPLVPGQVATVAAAVAVPMGHATEDRQELPSGIPLPDAKRALELLKDAAVGPLKAETAEVLGILAEGLPLNAVELLARSFLRVEVIAPNGRSTYLLPHLRGTYDRILREAALVPEEPGRPNVTYAAPFNHLSVRGRGATRDQLRPLVEREIARALSSVVGYPGLAFTDRPEWRGVAAEALAKAGSLSNEKASSRLFAKSVAIFLGWEQGTLEPGIRDSLQKFFERRVPTAIGEKNRHPWPRMDRKANDAGGAFMYANGSPGKNVKAWAVAVETALELAQEWPTAANIGTATSFAREVRKLGLSGLEPLCAKVDALEAEWKRHPGAPEAGLGSLLSSLIRWLSPRG